MRITVKLHGDIRRHHPDSNPHLPFEIEIPSSSTIADLAPILNIPDELVWAASVNKEAVELTRPLQEDDRVSLFPPVAGGQK